MFTELALQVIFMSGIATFIIAVWWGLLRLMDIGAGLKFRDAIWRLNTDARAMAMYLSARLLGTAILLAGLVRLVF